MSKYFKIPFANTGDKSPIPDDPQVDGSASYSEGWTPDYELPDGDPNKKDVDRLVENQFKNDVTLALKWVQEHAFLPYRTDVNYPAGGGVIGSDGAAYEAIWPNGPDSTIVDPVGDTTFVWRPKFIGGAGGRKNAFMNPKFAVWQRETLFDEGAGDFSNSWYTADRIRVVKLDSDPAANGVSVSRTQSDRENEYALEFSQSAGQYQIEERISDFHKFNGKQASFSMRCRHGGSGVLTVTIVALQCPQGIELVGTEIPIGTIDIQPGLDYQTHTIENVLIPSTDGAVPSEGQSYLSVAVRFPPYTTIPYSITIDEWQFEEGAFATSFEDRTLDEMLRDCRYYYEKIVGANSYIAAGFCGGAPTFNAMLKFSEKRTIREENTSNISVNVKNDDLTIKVPGINYVVDAADTVSIWDVQRDRANITISIVSAPLTSGEGGMLALTSGNPIPATIEIDAEYN